ncbi:MAG: GFA family protein [Bosea sp. (in: a-proteobacteria)]
MTTKSTKPSTAREVIHTGGCLCGSIRFEATGPAENPHTCSCSMCRRHTGSLTALWVEFPSENVRWTGPGGAPSTYRSSGYSSRAFCSTCGSSLGAIDDKPVVALLVGTFDKPNRKDLKPTRHSYRSGLPPWWKIEIKAE